jgi:hypothetical protein
MYRRRRLRALAHYGLSAKAQALRRLSPERRTATLLAALWQAAAALPDRAAKLLGRRPSHNKRLGEADGGVCGVHFDLICPRSDGQAAGSEGLRDLTDTENAPVVVVVVVVSWFPDEKSIATGSLPLRPLPETTTDDPGGPVA